MGYGGGTVPCGRDAQAAPGISFGTDVARSEDEDASKGQKIRMLAEIAGRRLLAVLRRVRGDISGATAHDIDGSLARLSLWVQCSVAGVSRLIGELLPPLAGIRACLLDNGSV